MRERPIHTNWTRDKTGITPARAGKTRADRRQQRHCQDHPRSCGKDSYCLAVHFLISGSPPLVRERQLQGTSTILFLGITPARAGKTWYSCYWVSETQDHPRSCGKDSNGFFYLRHFTLTCIQNLFNFFSRYQHFTTFTLSWRLLKLASTRAISILSSNRFVENYKVITRRRPGAAGSGWLRGRRRWRLWGP